MGGFKKSKNNPDNRNASGVNTCGICKQPRKYVKAVVATHRPKMAQICKCGIFDKSGTPIEE